MKAVLAIILVAFLVLAAIVAGCWLTGYIIKHESSQTDKSK